MYHGFRPKYQVELIKTNKKFPYPECIVTPIDLKKHPEQPQGGKWSDPKVSYNLIYIGAIFTINDVDALYIWQKQNLRQSLFNYKSSKILSYDFAPNNLSFIVFYEDQGPIHYNITNGKPIVSLQVGNLQMSKVLASSFSTQCRYFSIANETHFLIWDVLTGENKISLSDSSPSKYIRNDLLVTLTHKGVIKLINMTSSKKVGEIKLPSIKSHTDIISCMLSEDKEYFYFATLEGVFRTKISKVSIEDIIDFKQINPSKVFISSNCRKYISTDFNQINFWEYEKDMIGVIPHQNFNDLFVMIDKTICVIIDNISINIVDYSFPEDSQVIIWTNLNPLEFNEVHYTLNGTIMLTIIDDYNAILWNTINGNIIRKWYNNLPKWSKSLCLSPQTCEEPILAVKSGIDLIELWDCQKGSPVIPLVGFNAYNIAISADGLIIVAGSYEGQEIARVWNVEDYYNPKQFENEVMNYGTCVDISSDSSFFICHSQEQYPCAYEIQSEKLIFECPCEYTFTGIECVSISKEMSCFFSKGYNNKTPIAVLWSMNSGNVIKEFSNCTSLAFSPNSNFLFTNYVNPVKPSEDKISIWKIDSNYQLKCIDIPIVSEYNYFLSDSKFLASQISEQNLTRFILTDTESGEIMGAVKYIQKENGYSCLYLDLEEDEKNKTKIILYKATLAD